MEHEKNAIIYVFSGTGNTLKAVKEFEKKFNDLGISTTISKITADLSKLENPNSFDFVGLAYPIYGFNAPKPVIDFAKAMPNSIKSAGQKVFVVKTSGEPISANDASSLLLKKIIGRKGYEISNEYHYVMPYNMIFRHDDYTAVKMFETMQKLSAIDAVEIANNVLHTLSPSPFAKALSFVCRIEYPWFKHNGKRFKVDESKCVKCEKCVKNCPQSNIGLNDGKITFGNDCAMCASCSFNCPTAAISIGLLEGWKVNGAYPTSGNYKPSETKKHRKNYCKKAYDAYFRKAEEKINVNS